MVEDTSHSLVRGAGFGLGDQRRGIRVYGLVQVSDQKYDTGNITFYYTKSNDIYR